MTDSRRLLVSASDMDRLQRVVEQHNAGANADLADMLALELENAVVTRDEELPTDVVSMNSTVIFEDADTHNLREVTLCYPNEARGEGRISVLAPIGAALIGLSVGDKIDWPVPSGTRHLRIVAVPHQGRVHHASLNEHHEAAVSA